MKNIKIIFYENSCFLYWIYSNYNAFKSIYYAYRKSKYVISLIPFENDYLLKKWGINSVLMNNFVTYDYNQVIPSDLSSKTIIMIGRVNDRMKRFELGVESMKFIIREIPESKMIIISNSFYNDYLVKLVNLLNLDNNVDFVEYTSTPEIYFKNASLHIFPSISESFGLVLSEIKIFGIPTILVGLDYVSISKGGTIILYDDDSRSIAKEAIKILKDDKYRNKLGKEARKSMKKFNNELLIKKWVKLIISIYNDDNYFEDLKKNNSMTESEANIIIKTQIQLLKKRNPNYHKITIDNIKNLSLMLNIF
jgi:glycosyltransferase involved in cell wall biosynthesis